MSISLKMLNKMTYYPFVIFIDMSHGHKLSPENTSFHDYN